MRRTCIGAALPILSAVLVASSAHADSGADGNAGLDALNHGSYAEAVRLFTKALKAGDLDKDDQEFAYLSRGKAYLGEGKKALATADFKKAALLKPGDADVQAAMQSVYGGGVVIAKAAPVPINPDAAWGPIVSMLDKYWMELTPDPAAYSICRWQTPHRMIACEGLAKNGKQFAQTYELDPSTGVITFRATSPIPYAANVVVQDTSYTIDAQSANGRYRETYSPIDATHMQMTFELYEAGTLKGQKTYGLIQTTPEFVQALNWRPGKDKTHSVWKDIGQSLGAAAAAAIVQGLQPQPQQ